MEMQIPNVPHLAQIETTYACNQSCRFCYNPNRHMKIDSDVIDKIVKSVYDSWIPHVYLMGGEPSLLGTEKLNEYIDLLSQRSSITIVTNGQICLKGLSDNVACIGVPIHGIGDAHDYLAGKKGSFKTAINTIEYYVKRGFDVRCVPVLAKTNFDQMYDIIKLAKSVGMDQVFVDRYEDGGIGSTRSLELKPSLEQFRFALGQMIRGRDDFNITVGWGTAIPFCLDERLVSENMFADCGAGITFCAISPKGNVRVCNQSERVYGNVLDDPLEIIWHKPEFSEFRSLGWVEKPCSDCNVMHECMCGCKVDINHSEAFCIDYAVRENGNLCKPQSPSQNNKNFSVPPNLRHFIPNRYAKLNQHHNETYLVTRYQTIILDDTSTLLIKQILSGITDEKSLIENNVASIDMEDMRQFISMLEFVQAIDITGG